MHKVLSQSLLGATFLVGLAAPVQAATIIGTYTDPVSGVTLTFQPNPTHLPDRIVGADDDDDANPLMLSTDSNVAVTVTSSATLEQDGSDGFASISELGNGPKNDTGFADLKLDPATGFTAINFGLTALGSGNDSFYGDIILDILNDGQVLFENVLITSGGTQHFGISSTSNVVFDSIQFRNLFAGEANTGAVQNFAALRQPSIEIAQIGNEVPEPSTWAMLLFGFGAIGFGMRRRKTQGGATRVRVAYS